MPHSLGKAKQRVARHLPQSPCHKKELILPLVRQIVKCFHAKGNNNLLQATVDKFIFLDMTWKTVQKHLLKLH